MKKVLNKKFSGPSNLVGKVFFKHNLQTKEGDVDSTAALNSSDLPEDAELDRLKAKINNLTQEIESKDVKIAKLAREKEQLSLGMGKVNRSNDSLTKQLEDERKFYFKEKRVYCEEMNEYKKLKKVLSGSNVTDSEEVEKLKTNLEQTLHTNYNLSVKFLRMKETKNQLSISLLRAEDKYKKVVANLNHKIGCLTSELSEILSQKFNAPLSPSNKKYLKLVNENSNLVYENLRLQMHVDHLNLKLRRCKLLQTKSESNTNRERPRSRAGAKIIKIFERETKAGVPTVTILNETEIGHKGFSSERKLALPILDGSKLDVFQVSGLQSRASGTDSVPTRQRSRSAPRIVQNVLFKNFVTATT